MANYTTKLVDHTDKTAENLLKAILKDTQLLFDEVFDGTKTQVAVSWGAATDIDNYVVHFVEDKANSYLRKISFCFLDGGRKLHSCARLS